jgi:short-subunit dehydrogenase
MSQGRKNNIAIIGHTRGIGKAIADLYNKKKYQVIGMSRSNGFDLEKDHEKILEKIIDCELVVLNAHSGTGQLTLLKRIYEMYVFANMKVAVITSTSGLDGGADYNEFELWNKFEYVQYCEQKKALIEYISDLQDELLTKPLSVYDICPDVVDTDMTKGLWEALPKLKPHEVADAVRYCFESTCNINKIVLQKNAH